MNERADSDETIFARALQLESPVERGAYLDSACSGDAERRRRIEELILASIEAETFLERPAHVLQSLAAAGATRATLKVEDLGEGASEGPGKWIGRYKLLQQIGEGGCGTVFMAEQESPVRRRVALKVIKLGMDTKSVVARFEAERQALAMMDHPNIARVFDAGATESGRPFFVMELVRGIPITRYCDEHRLDTQQRLDLFLKVCQAIQHAHQKGIIHRDIKPSNILVPLHDGVPVPKVIDFGIAKATEGRLTEQTLFTAFEQFIGTPAYMSPEQAELSGLDIDTRSDIYSLGVLLYELLSGSTPFDAKELMASGIDAMRKMIRETEPVRPSTRLATLGMEQLTTTAKRRSAETGTLVLQLKGDLDWIVMKCLEKDRQRRYETANGLAADILRHLENEPVLASPPSVVYRVRKAVRRNRLVFISGAVIAMALVLGVGTSTWQALRATRAEERAVTRQREAEHEKDRADTQTRKALASHEQSRRLLYAADMSLAQQALRQNNLGRARQLLDRHRPGPEEQDLRGWEWRYLWQESQSEAHTLLLKRPTKRVLSISFSPDGSRLAVGYYDGQVELWDIARRMLIRELTPANGTPACVAYAPQSNHLVATEKPGILKLYDLSSGRETNLWESPRTIITKPFITRDGSRLVACTTRGTNSSAVTFDLVGASAVRTNNTSRIDIIFTEAARLSENGKRLFLSHSDPQPWQNRVRCLNAETGQELWDTQVALDTGVTAMALSPDEKTLVVGVGYQGKALYVLDTETGKQLHRLDGHSGWVTDLAFSRDGRWVASASSDDSIGLWDAQNWTLSRVIRGHEANVLSVAFSPDGRVIASGGKDGSVLLWDVAPRGSRLGNHRFPPDVTFVNEFTPGQALSLVKDVQKAVIRLDDFSLSRELFEVIPESSSILLFPKMIGGFNRTNSLRIFEIQGESFRFLNEILVGTNAILHRGSRDMDFADSTQERLVAWGEEEQDSPVASIHFASIDPPTRRWHWTSGLHRAAPIEFSPDGQLVLLIGMGSEGRIMEVREVKTGKLRMHSEHALVFPPKAKFADGGRKLVVVGKDTKTEVTKVIFWDVTQPEKPPIEFTEPGLSRKLTVSPNGRWVGTGSDTGIVSIYDMETLTRNPNLVRGSSAVYGLDFSADSRSLISGFKGSEAVKVWQVETGQELLVFPADEYAISRLSFVEEGNTILAGSSGRTNSWQLWRAPTWAEINAAEANRKAENRSP